MIAKPNLNNIKSLIVWSLIKSYVILYDCDLITDMLRKYDYMKEQINNPKTSQVKQNAWYTYKQCYLFIWSIKRKQRVKTEKL